MSKTSIAIVGMAGRFPGAKDVEQFWANLAAGHDAISEIERWSHERFYHPHSQHNTASSKWAGQLIDIDQFDPGFFNISPLEAQSMDPQQRLLLVEAWRCIENSGVRLGLLQQQTTAVFVASMAMDHQLHQASLQSDIHSHSCLGSYAGLLSNRLSYCLTLTGTSKTIDTACSGSLVALHDAVLALSARDCDFALVGGVNLLLHPWKTISFAKSRMLSPEGQCRAFDLTANGYVAGEGAAVVMVTTEQNALDLGLNIHGLIAGSASSHSGDTVSITAPGIAPQSQLIDKVLKKSRIRPEQVNYIETHGTGTSLGDPIEIEALNCSYGHAMSYCPIGAVKTQIGHLEAAAGLAGLIKVLLMLKHRKIPPNLHLTDKNPLIQFEDTPFDPVTRLTDWKAEPPLAAISSFGFGGANAHILVKAATNQPPADTSVLQHFPWLISAKTAKALSNRCEQFNRLTEARQSAVAAALLNQPTFRYRSAGIWLNGQLQWANGTSQNHILAMPTHWQPAEFEQLVANNPAFRQALEATCPDWPQTMRHQAAWGQWLNHLNTGSKGWQLDGIGAAIACGLLHPDDDLSGPQLDLRWPNKRVFNRNRQRINLLQTHHVDQLLSQLQMDAGQTEHWITTARQLFPHQHTFMQLIEVWHEPTIQYGYPLLAVVKEDQAIDYHSHEAQTLAMVILIVLRRVYQKWQFEHKLKYPNQAVRLWACITDMELLDKQQCLHYLQHKQTSQDNGWLCQQLNQHAHQLADELSSLWPRACSKVTLDALPCTLEPPHEDYQVINEVNIPWLVQCWLSGADIDWFYYFDKSQFPPSALPGYPFDDRSMGDGNYHLPEAQQADTAAKTPAVSTDIAIIGYSAQLPGATNPDQYWQLLTEGKCTVSEVPPSRWDVEQYFDPDPQAANKSYGQWGGFIDGHDLFDPGFFNILPADATLMDPQSRLVLLETWRALEQAGYAGIRRGKLQVGAYVGVLEHNYYEKIAIDAGRTVSAAEYTGNAPSILAGRVAYTFNLRGPTLCLNTACSSSLVCVDLACDALRNGKADVMLAGGVTLWLLHTPYIQMSRLGMLSPTGNCRAFDDNADGIAPSEGAGFVVLSRLADAQARGDHIHAVIKAGGINQDGRSNGITAPNLEAQQQLIETVYRKFGIHPDDISYIETHGTGTKLGDPVELSALHKAYSRLGCTQKTIPIGSVKSNLGHTSAAAGIASLIKVMLCFKHQQLVPSLHFDKPNQHIDFSAIPFKVCQHNQPWQSQGPRLAAINSFGFSGTNAHVVLAEYQADEVTPRQQSARYLPFALSAKRKSTLQSFKAQLLTWCQINHDKLDLANLSFSLTQGRAQLSQRQLIWATDIHQLCQQLSGQTPAPADLPTPLKTLEQAWTQGGTLDFSPCYQGLKVHIIAAPGSCFDLKPYSYSATKQTQVPPKAGDIEIPCEHPLYQQHRWQQRPIFPATGSMQLLLGLQSLPVSFNRLRFQAPIRAREAQNLSLLLKPGRILFNAKPAVMGQVDTSPITTKVPQLEDLQSGLTAVADFAERFETQVSSNGFDYGPVYQCYRQALLGQDLALVELEAPKGQTTMTTQAAMLDAGMRLGFLFCPPGAKLPTGVDRWEVLKPLPSRCWAHVTPKGVHFVDEHHNLLQAVHGFKYADLETSSPQPWYLHSDFEPTTVTRQTLPTPIVSLGRDIGLGHYCTIDQPTSLQKLAKATVAMATGKLCLDIRRRQPTAR